MNKCPNPPVYKQSTWVKRKKIFFVTCDGQRLPDLRTTAKGGRRCFSGLVIAGTCPGSWRPSCPPAHGSGQNSLSNCTAHQALQGSSGSGGTRPSEAVCATCTN